MPLQAFSISEPARLTVMIKYSIHYCHSLFGAGTISDQHRANVLCLLGSGDDDDTSSKIRKYSSLRRMTNHQNHEAAVGIINIFENGQTFNFPLFADKTPCTCVWPTYPFIHVLFTYSFEWPKCCILIKSLLNDGMYEQKGYDIEKSIS